MPVSRKKTTGAEIRRILAFPFAVFMTGVLSVAGFCSVFVFHLVR